MANISTAPISDFDAAVRLLSRGTNVAIYNDLGLPSIYVRRDKGAISDVIDGGPDTTHYAFRVNGVEVPAFYMGKYLATVYKGRALSLPLQDPAAFTVASADCGDAADNRVNFDNAKIWCEANGAGFHLPTIAEYAWIALLSRKNGTMPNGNNNYGRDHTYKFEKGIGSDIDAVDQINRTLTGSGPATWNDNWKPDGICDLNGNVYEWQGGYRTVDGEIQIFADNDAAAHADQSTDSTSWKAILQDGTLVEPGTDGSLKWDYDAGLSQLGKDSPFHLNTVLTNQQVDEAPNGGMIFDGLDAATGVAVPNRLGALALMPTDGGPYSALVTMRNIGERIVCRGGCWRGVYDGVFSTNGTNQRSYYGADVGFRPAFIPEI